MKYYLGTIDEDNGGMEYNTKFVFATDGDEDEYMDKVASEWRDGASDYDEGHSGYWSDDTLIQAGACQEIPEADFVVLAKYLAVL